MTVLAVDPGLRACGVAYFTRGRLTRAALVRGPVRKLRGPQAWRLMGRAVWDWVGSDQPHRIVIEVPQVYAGRMGGDPDDLIQLAGVDGAIVQALRPAHISYYLPRAWKGQVPKDIHVARTERKLAPEELTAIEPCPASLRHNILDAIGLGLFYLRR